MVEVDSKNNNKKSKILFLIVPSLLSFMLFNQVPVFCTFAPDFFVLLENVNKNISFLTQEMRILKHRLAYL